VNTPAQLCSGLLDKLLEEMHRAAKRADAETIHDVRVAIRRLRQALTVFRNELPNTFGRKIDKRLRKLLKSAGKIRNLDVAMELLQPFRTSEPKLMRLMRKDRQDLARDLQTQLAAMNEKRSVEKWRAKLADRAARKGQDAKRGDDVTRELLASLAVEFFNAGAEAATDDSDPEALHNFRIRTKKFRYSLELFSPLYDSDLARRITTIRKLQTRLGEINDFISTAAMLKRYRREHAWAATTEVQASIGRLQRGAARKIDAFRNSWRKSFSSEQKRDWAHYFAGRNAANLTK
jgi:CHAD domain-containing protein